MTSKFSMDGAFKGNFAPLESFHDGPEKLIGFPNPDVVEGIRREHCERSNASKPFTTTNYFVTTTPKLEHEFVVMPRKDFKYPHTPKDKSKWSTEDAKIWKGVSGRECLKLEHFLQLDTAKDANVKPGEVTALRLYSGPMFFLYNAFLRKSQPIYDSLDGNKYETTIFCITSGITKLSKLSKIPEDRRLYRGLGGMILPETFQIARDGLRGGVELGLMSTTTSKDVAMNYSGQLGCMFQITAGRIDIGADLSWLSQYPAEAEYLFPPLSCLEVIDEPKIEGNVMIFPLRVNVNLKCLTLEQLESRRKDLHLAMIKNLREELDFQSASLIYPHQIQTSILEDVDFGDRIFIEMVIERIKSFKSNEKEKLFNFEVKHDKEFYVLTAFLQKEENTIQFEELESIKKELNEQGHLSIQSIAVVFQDLKTCLRVLILRKDSSSSIQMGRKSTIYQDLSDLENIVKRELDVFLHQHELIDAQVYNVDDQYKTLTKEAIEAKTFAMIKIKLFIKARTSHSENSGLLERIRKTEFNKYGREHIFLELESGAFDFPWKDMLEDNDTIDFKGWSPESLQHQQLDMIGTVVGKKYKCTKVLIQGFHFAFPDGVFAQDIKLDKPLLPGCVATMAFLLSLNTHLISLHVRGENLDVENWRQIANAVTDRPRLRDLGEFKWSRKVLAPAVDTIELTRTLQFEGYSVLIGVVVLGVLLSRHSNTLKTLVLW